MHIIGAILARNEAAPDRYLAKCVQNALALCDGVVLLNDGSIDGTPALARSLGCEVVERGQGGANEEGWWGSSESSARAELWRLASERADWIYVFDADHELLGATRDDFHALASAEHANAWSFALMDCWDSPDTHRVDGYWRAWAHPRPWLVKLHPFEGYAPEWRARGIHAGHLPTNFPIRAVSAPPTHVIRHCGYISPTARAAKVKQYLALASP